MDPLFKLRCADSLGLRPGTGKLTLDESITPDLILILLFIALEITKIITLVFFKEKYFDDRRLLGLEISNGKSLLSNSKEYSTRDFSSSRRIMCLNSTSLLFNTPDV